MPSAKKWSGSAPASLVLVPVARARRRHRQPSSGRVGIDLGVEDQTTASACRPGKTARRCRIRRSRRTRSRAGGSTSSQNPVTPVHSAAGVGATSGVSAPDDASSRWMPTTTARVGGRLPDQQRQIGADEGEAADGHAVGHRDDPQLGRPSDDDRLRAAAQQLGERVPVRAHRGRGQQARKALSSPALPPVDGKSSGDSPTAAVPEVVDALELRAGHHADRRRPTAATTRRAPVHAGQRHRRRRIVERPDQEILWLRLGRDPRCLG